MNFKAQTTVIAGATARICNEEIRKKTFKLLLIFEWTETNIVTNNGVKIAFSAIATTLPSQKFYQTRNLSYNINMQ